METKTKKYEDMIMEELDRLGLTDVQCLGEATVVCRDAGDSRVEISDGHDGGIYAGAALYDHLRGCQRPDWAEIIDTDWWYRFFPENSEATVN